MIMYANSSRSTSLLLLFVVINNCAHTHERMCTALQQRLLKMDDAVCRMHFNTHSQQHRQNGQCNGAAHVKLHMIQITILILQMIVFVLNE